jgi:hypothetical protein
VISNGSVGLIARSLKFAHGHADEGLSAGADAVQQRSSGFITRKEDAVKLKGIAVAAAVAGLGLTSAASAHAASAAAVCVKKGGAVRFVTAKAKCHKGERRMGLQGRTGATGAQGPAGQTGPAGATGETGLQGKPGLTFLSGPAAGTWTPTFGIGTGVSFTLSGPGRVLVTGSANVNVTCSPGSPQIGWVLFKGATMIPIAGSQFTPPSGAARLPLVGVSSTLAAGTYDVDEYAGCTGGGTIQGGSSIGSGAAWVFLLDA